MNRPSFPRFALAALAALAGLLTVAPAADHPNVVWILSEDNSKHYLELFDEDGTETPNIRALAEDGVTFTRAFSNNPVCSVARTTLATGCYAPRIGTQFHRKSKLAQLPDGLKLFPAYLREAGYYTTNNRKKDYNCVETPGTWDESSGKATWRNRPDDSQPFFHMESHAQSHESSLHFGEAALENEPTDHDPTDVSLPPYFPDTELFRYTRARYLDNIRTIDGIVGKTVAKLEEDGLLEDTFIFYFGDHGGVLPRSKGYIYESGLHVPLVVRVPENWKHLVDFERGAETDGFVSFIDFAPTVLELAGLDAPGQMDGRAFLGEEVSQGDVAERDTAFGHTDRFDEKYGMSRSLRIGDWKYIREYQPYYPDALHNNYRYFMLAYRQWRDLYDAGKLGSDQRLFFEPKPTERLFHLAHDPHEVNDLADEEEHRDRLVSMRRELDTLLREEVVDLSFFPENVLYDEAMDDPVAFGRANRERLGRLMDTANLMVRPTTEAIPVLREALRADDPLVRYWAATACAAFGERAVELSREAKRLLRDDDPMVRIRAAEFLGLIGKIDPREPLIEVINGADHPVEQLIAFNAVALFHAHLDLTYPFDPDSFTGEFGKQAQRRMLYLRGDWLDRWKKRHGGE